jgi:Uma2 family endonuclease
MSAASFPSLIELAPRGRAMTVDEWLALDEDEPGELVEGHLEEEEVPDYVHELTISFLIVLLGHWLGDDGYVIGSEAKMRLFGKTGRKPDLIVHLRGTPPPPAHGPLVMPPDLVVEVVTPTPRDERRDRVEKSIEYARFGIRFYWIVDPALGTFEIFQLEPDGLYKRVIAATAGAIDAVPGCPGLRIDLDKLWARLATLPRE